MKKLYLKTLFAGFFSLSFLITNAQYGWTQKANFPGVSRNSTASFSIGHYGYVGCGVNGSNRYADWWRWNQDSNTWTQIASYPGAGQGRCTSFSIGGKGYVGLGFGNTVYSDLWQYDTATNTWTQMASFTGAARLGAMAFVIGTNAYMCNGSPGGPPYFTDCWKYNSITNTWSQIADFPLANVGTTLVYSIGSYGYAGCGGTGGGSDISSMYQYDTTSNTWTAIASVPSSNGLAIPAYFVLDDTAYSISGTNSQANFLDEVFSYNPNTNTWNTLSNFPGMARNNGVGFSIGSKGYVATGLDSIGTSLADLWQYAPENITGINDLSNSNSILIYPNPAKDEIYIQLNGNEKAEMLELYTITGQRVVSIQLPVVSNDRVMEIKTSGLEDGVYFLKVQMQDGSTMVRKVAIQK